MFSLYSMFSNVFELFFDIFHYFYKVPLVKKITKKSLMGNNIDKTLEYYMYGIEISPLDDEYFIKYNHKNRDYILVCDKDDLDEAVKFIKRRSNLNIVNRIHVASEEHYPKQYLDITSKIKMFAGPEENFYINTAFHVKKRHITEYNLYILTKDFKRHFYSENDKFISL